MPSSCNNNRWLTSYKVRILVVRPQESHCQVWTLLALMPFHQWTQSTRCPWSWVLRVKIFLMLQAHNLKWAASSTLSIVESPILKPRCSLLLWWINRTKLVYMEEDPNRWCRVAIKFKFRHLLEECRWMRVAIWWSKTLMKIKIIMTKMTISLHLPSSIQEISIYHGFLLRVTPLRN